MSWHRTAAVVTLLMAPALTAGTGASADQLTSASRGDAAHLNFYQPAALNHSWKAQYPGKYRLKLGLEVHGQFEFDPGRCRAILKADGCGVWTNDFGWQNGKKFNFEITQDWQAGEHPRPRVRQRPVGPGVRGNAGACHDRHPSSAGSGADVSGRAVPGRPARRMAPSDR